MSIKKYLADFLPAFVIALIPLCIGLFWEVRFLSIIGVIIVLVSFFVPNMNLDKLSYKILAPYLLPIVIPFYIVIQIKPYFYSVFTLLVTFFIPMLLIYIVIFFVSDSSTLNLHFITKYSPLVFTISAMATTQFGQKIVKYFYDAHFEEGEAGKKFNPFNQDLIRCLFYIAYFSIMLFIYIKKYYGSEWIDGIFTSEIVLGSFALYISFDRVMQMQFIKDFDYKKAFDGFVKHLKEPKFNSNKPSK